MDRLTDKVAIVTGGAAGIGLAAGRMFHDEGAKVVLVDIADETLQQAAESLGEGVTAVRADVTDEAQVENLMRTVVDLHGRVDVMLANAGIEGLTASIEDYPTDMFDRVMSVNVRSVWLCLKHVFPVMREAGGGSVVITSSTAGLYATTDFAPYITSKHALVGLMRSAALEGASSGIRVNTIHPAPVETRMYRAIEEMRSGTQDAATLEETRAAARRSIPLGRYALPEEIAQLMLFLASDESSFCTGSTYAIDGGKSAGR